MILFNCDYLEGAHEAILKRLQETNMQQETGYGEDSFCKHARELIREQVKDEDAYVQFIAGGTQTNMILLSSMLRSHEGVIAADTGHIAVHESGAIEATGHKVITLPNTEGKITAEQVGAYAAAHYADDTHEHMVKPQVVFVSFPSEVGTIYSKAELKALRKVCDKYGMYLYLDGARLGYGLMSEQCDLTLSDIYKLTDAFYIGGTKQGALLGEAAVIRNRALRKEFRYILKQRGGMMAKGRILGIQFETLFDGKGTDCLYFRLSAHADRLAAKFRDGLAALSVPVYQESFTNQQFPVLPDKVLKKLSKNYSFAYWGRVDETHSAVRFCMSWATKEENVDKLLKKLEKLLK